jgi:hypothetical protein
VDDKRALNIVPKLWQRKLGRGAFYLHRRCGVSHAGAARKANVGISNDKAGEKPAHRKTKVS